MVKTAILLAFLLLVALAATDHWLRPVMGQADKRTDKAALIRLGNRLFEDERFATPRGDLVASCSTCHIFDENPQGIRAYTDFFIRSWVSSREKDPRRLMLRNSPTILDCDQMPRLHYDGEFASLEELVKGTLMGRPMGWLPGEESLAYAHARTVLLNDTGAGNQPAYRQQFRQAFGVDLAKLTADETVTLIAQAVADYCRALKTRRTSAYDRFIQANQLPEQPQTRESNADFAGRLLEQLKAIEAQGTLKLMKEFDATALAGMKLFFNPQSGNCAACHAPPLFTDQSFHNLGITQREFDQVHGAGKFAALAIPGVRDAQRPAPQFRQTPAKDHPDEADLGYWNFVDVKRSQLRRADESDDQFLQRMVATFKTPTLRNLQYTQPYFHNGALHTLEEAVNEIRLLSEMARANQVRAADAELLKIHLTSSDITPLVAFLNSLNEELRAASYRFR